MTGGEWIAGVLVALLALYGCAALIRRVGLWFARCPTCAVCCRVAIPNPHTALSPLLRCLQSQSVWEDSFGCRCTLLLLPDHTAETEEELNALFELHPAVIPVTGEQLMAMLDVIAKEP